MSDVTRSYSRCGSCHALIIWAVSAKSGKAMPIDAVPVDNGNVVLTDDAERPTATVHASRPLGHDGPMFVSHFATCPEARSHRKR